MRSEALGIITQSATPAVPLPQLPSAAVTVSTVSIDGRIVATYAVVHTALLRSHASANSAAVLSALAERGARTIFLLSAVHHPIFTGLRCQVPKAQSLFIIKAQSMFIIKAQSLFIIASFCSSSRFAELARRCAVS